MARTIVVLLALCAGCGPRYLSPRSGDGALLNRTPTLFMRLFGSGPLAPPSAPVTYELCYDFAQNKVVEVHDAATGRDVDAAVARVFFTWKWGLFSSVRTTGGLRCWRERFEPVTAVDGSVTVHATPAEPVGLMHLDDGTVAPARGRPEDEEHVAFVDRFEDHGVAYVMLVPRLSVVDGTAAAPPSPSWQLQKVAGEVPHLLDLTRMRFRGNTMHAIFRVCVDRSGRVASVLAEVPLDGETIRMERTIEAWRFTAPPVPACGMNDFVYSIGP